MSVGAVVLRALVGALLPLLGAPSVALTAEWRAAISPSAPMC
ncbi:hypothetical protein ACLMAJ_09995 [Nocardia sp. KC 131]